MTNWKNKLLAFLHDPPEKAYDYGPQHKERVTAYLSRLGIHEKWDPAADHAAAAADRFIFPATRRREGDHWVRTGAPILGEGVSFRHPTNPAIRLRAEFPEEAEAMDILSSVFPEFPALAPQEAHWLLWRCWLHHAVTHKAGQKARAEWLAYLPADTRIPDGTIWHHMSVASALESALGEGQQPAFLLFQVGPVQEFIAQARSTRDLWSGSFLLSWMMAHAIKVVTDALGPDAVIFPSLRGQPLFDWLHRPLLEQAKYETAQPQSFWTSLGLDQVQELALIPNLPHRFLAVVPGDFKPETLASVFDAEGWNSDQPTAEWAKVVRACWDSLPKDGMPANRDQLWDFQVRHFWQVTWQLWPWQDVNSTLGLFKAIPLGQHSALPSGHAAAWAIPDPHKDERCYRGGTLDRGWAWSAHYQLLSHRLDARRQTRDFAAWQSTDKPAHKDYFSGKEEVIATSEWLRNIGQHAELRHLFRANDELGAINLIKRVWHKLYLERLSEFHQGVASLTRARQSFDSVMAVAAAPFARRLFQLSAAPGRLREALLEFICAASEAREDFPDSIAPFETDERGWFQRTDACVFFTDTWERAIKETDHTPARSRLGKAVDSLRVLQGKCGGPPSKYFAVLALDGDQIGKWLSGEHPEAPRIREVITGAAASYFQEQVRGVDAEAWLASKRPLSPSYHLQFSEALANFGLYCARRIVEHHGGQLIYSGGDDVLAMLPAEEAIACAQGLRLAFQGSPELPETYSALFAGCPPGWIKLKDGDWSTGARRPAEPSWPLLVPGPRATVSVGLAIGHVKEPLQDMVQEAQAAEKRAKADPQSGGWDRDALAVTLFKRSGETLHWGAKFGSPAFDLLRQLREHYRSPVEAPGLAMPISGKFPYRIAELLGRYEVDQPLSQELKDIAESEVAWAIQQQTWNDKQAEQASSAFRRATLLNQCIACLQHLLTFEWEPPAETGGQKRKVKAARPLREFINLFAVEAFIARQGE